MQAFRPPHFPLTKNTKPFDSRTTLIPNMLGIQIPTVSDHLALWSWEQFLLSGEKLNHFTLQYLFSMVFLKSWVTSLVSFLFAGGDQAHVGGRLQQTGRPLAHQSGQETAKLVFRQLLAWSYALSHWRVFRRRFSTSKLDHFNNKTFSCALLKHGMLMNTGSKLCSVLSESPSKTILN